MKNTVKLAVTAALVGIGGVAHAATVTPTSNTFNVSATQIDTNLTSTATSSSNVTPTGTAPTLGQFNPRYRGSDRCDGVAELQPHTNSGR